MSEELSDFDFALWKECLAGTIRASVVLYLGKVDASCLDNLTDDIIYELCERGYIRDLQGASHG